MDKEAVPSPLDEGKLNVKFVEYMMGLPVGWVTDVDLPRSQKLKITLIIFNKLLNFKTRFKLKKTF
jgi:hypothetical protein